jgi:hypothetical protein
MVSRRGENYECSFALGIDVFDHVSICDGNQPMWVQQLLSRILYCRCNATSFRVYVGIVTGWRSTLDII